MQLTPLSALANYRNGFAFKPEDRGIAGLPIVRIEQLLNPDAEPDLFEGVIPTTNRITDGDLIFSWSGTLAVRFWDRGPAYLNQHLFRVDPRPGVDKRWLRWALEEAIERMKPLMHGSAMTHITRRVLEETRVPMPPEATQRTIASYLDTETARLDRLVGANERLVALVWQRFRQIRRELLADGLLLGAPDLVPRLAAFGWAVPRLWMVCRNHDGKRIPLNAEERASRPGPYPYWGANAIQGYVDDWLFEGSHVLVGEDGAPYFDEERDVAWVADGQFWVNNHAHVLEPRGLEAEWLAECLNVVDYSQFVVGSTRDKLTQAALNSVPIPLPPPESRSKVLAELREVRSQAEAVEMAVARNVVLLKERRQAMITAAVTGELEV